MRVLLLLITAVTAATAATACGQPKPSSRPGPAVVANPSTDALDPLPIAGYLGQDKTTEQRVFELLDAAGIEATAGGSIGESVWVSGADRAKAQQLLLVAAASECLAVTIYDDQGASIPVCHPPCCSSAPPGPSAGP